MLCLVVSMGVTLTLLLLVVVGLAYIHSSLYTNVPYIPAHKGAPTLYMYTHTHTHTHTHAHTHTHRCGYMTGLVWWQTITNFVPES